MRSIINNLLFCGVWFFFYPTAYSQPPSHPESYNCFRTHYPIAVDGVLEECEWGVVPWSKAFVDIQGERQPKPLYSTRVKMLWDDRYFYFATEIKEPHIWAYLRQRDTVIYHDNDFEIFIDPQGDNHHYYEFEINALNTVWDLLLTKPYRDGGKAIDSWDIAGLKSATRVYGTINDGTDIDSMWTIEIAIPWEVLEECASHKGKPYEEEVWRVNFSRVNWRTQFIEGKYVKEKDPSIGRNLPEYNWVWSVQGAIAMHQPETWGYVRFINQTTPQQDIPLYEDIDYPAKIELMSIYSQLFNIYKDKKSMQTYLKTVSKDIVVEFTSHQFTVTKKGRSGIAWVVNQEGKLYVVK